MPDGRNQSVRPDHAIIANIYRGNIQNRYIVVRQKVLSDMDIFSAVTVEIRLNIHIFTSGAEQLLDRRKLGLVVGGVVFFTGYNSGIKKTVFQSGVQFFKLGHISPPVLSVLLNQICNRGRHAFYFYGRCIDTQIVE